MEFFHNRVKPFRNNVTCSVCRSIIFLLLLLSVSGCKIDFEAQTVVEPDGSMARTTRYVADEDSDKKELETYYDLPAGGTWTTRESIKTEYGWDVEEKEVKGTINIYEATKRYTPGEPISPDYRRRGKTSERVSSNEVRLTVHNHVFVKTFDYEEHFRDVGSKEGTITAARKFYTLWVGHLAEQLAQELKGSVSITQARQALNEIYGPLLTKFIEGVQDGGRAFLESNVFEEEILGPMGEKERIVAQLVEALPPPADEQAESWSETISRFLDNIDDTGDDAGIESFFKDTGLEEELYGVYGFTIFQTYGFKTTLSLPGNIVDSNATKQNGDILTWEFGTSDFLWQDYVLSARSRIIYRGRIALGGATIVCILVILGIFIRKSDKRRKTS